jgi:hypothetical protein
MGHAAGAVYPIGDQSLSLLCNKFFCFSESKSVMHESPIATNEPKLIILVDCPYVILNIAVVVFVIFTPCGYLHVIPSHFMGVCFSCRVDPARPYVGRLTLRPITRLSCYVLQRRGLQGILLPFPLRL